jgi:hypothetical protein
MNNGQPDWSRMFATWRHYRNERTLPHSMYSNPTRTVCAIILRRGRNGDWPVNCRLLQEADEAVREGRLAVYVVQADGLKVLYAMPVAQVLANVANAQVVDGIYGPYYWLVTETFMPAGTVGGASDDVPF